MNEHGVCLLTGVSCTDEAGLKVSECVCLCVTSLMNVHVLYIPLDSHQIAHKISPRLQETVYGAVCMYICTSLASQPYFSVYAHAHKNIHVHTYIE